MCRKQVSIIKELSSRIAELAGSNVRLQYELEQEQVKNQHFWNHIRWLCFCGDESVRAGQCPFYGSHRLGLRDDDSQSKWQVVCKCGAQSPAYDTELGAIEAWNEVAKLDFSPHAIQESW